MNVHVFNPEHDIALASNNKFWTAPHAGRQLRSDLGWLPVLWAEDDDIVIVDDVTQAQSSTRKLNRKTAAVRFATLDMLRNRRIDISGCTAVKPWGWDLSITQQLRRADIPDSLLPTDETLAIQRRLSDRSTAAHLLHDICHSVDGCCGEAVAITDAKDIERYTAEWGSIVLKAPWSSSGRGVRYMDQRPSNIIRWAEKVIEAQGHLMVERLMDKVMDFGMEFNINADGSVSYLGLSLFSTTAGAYTGSILATESEKVAVITRYVSEQLLRDIQSFVCTWMQREVNGAYVGPFGVDMMLCKSSDDRITIDPCVEVNLRRTMGHVALCVSPAQPDMQQIMRIGYEGSNYHFRIINDHEMLF